MSSRGMRILPPSHHAHHGSTWVDRPAEDPRMQETNPLHPFGVCSRTSPSARSPSSPPPASCSPGKSHTHARRMTTMSAMAPTVAPNPMSIDCTGSRSEITGALALSIAITSLRGQAGTMAWTCPHPNPDLGSVTDLVEGTRYAAHTGAPSARIPPAVTGVLQCWTMAATWDVDPDAAE